MKKPVKVLIALFVLLIVSFYIDNFVLELIKTIRAGILDKTFIFIDKYLNYYVLAFIITLIPLLKNKERLRNLLKFWVSFLSAGILVYVLKILIARPRPLLSLIEELDYSFPSGHATIMFALLPVFLSSFKEYRYYWLVLALLISFSRIYLGVHYLSDVIGGIILGLIVGTNIIKIFKLKLKYG